MSVVSVRRTVVDLKAATDFYCALLGFGEQITLSPTFAMLTRGDLCLLLSAPGGDAGGDQATSATTPPHPGEDRLSIDVDDLDATAAALRSQNVTVRGEGDRASGARHLLIEDPFGNPVELRQPVRHEPDRQRFDVRPIGYVFSTLDELAQAPRQGNGAPDAWLVIHQDVRDGVRDIEPGDELLVLTWLHLSRRDELSTVPGDDPGGRERGVFSTRSPARPNPIGVHHVIVREVDDGRLRVGPLEAIDGTPLVDIKPVITPAP